MCMTINFKLELDTCNVVYTDLVSILYTDQPSNGHCYARDLVDVLYDHFIWFNPPQVGTFY